jgi:hypothetical protein
VAAGGQTFLREFEVASGRCGQVNDVRADFLQELIHVVKNKFNLMPFRQLRRHEPFAIARRNETTSGKTPNLVGMLVGNLAATHNGDAKTIHAPVVLAYSK